MLININHLLLFIFFSTSFILLANAHLILFCSSLLSSFIRAGNVLYRSPITPGNLMYGSPIYSGEPHVWSPIYANSRGERQYRCRLRRDSCMVRPFSLGASCIAVRLRPFSRGASCIAVRLRPFRSLPFVAHSDFCFCYSLCLLCVFGLSVCSQSCLLHSCLVHQAASGGACWRVL